MIWLVIRDTHESTAPIRNSAFLFEPEALAELEQQRRGFEIGNLNREWTRIDANESQDDKEMRCSKIGSPQLLVSPLAILQLFV